MALYATFADVDLAYEGTIPTTDQLRVENLILRASTRLGRMQTSLDYRLGTGEIDPDLPKGLVVEAVLRVYRNPEGVTAEEIGPFHKQFNPRAVAAEIQFDEKEVADLLAPIPSYRQPSIRVAMPTRAQTLYEVGGQDWSPDPQYLADPLGITDAVLAVKTP